MAEKVELDTFKPCHHKLKQNIEIKLMELLKECDFQFAQDETTIGTTDNRYRKLWTSVTKAIPNSNETLQMG